MRQRTLRPDRAVQRTEDWTSGERRRDGYVTSGTFARLEQQDRRCGARQIRGGDTAQLQPFEAAAPVRGHDGEIGANRRPAFDQRFDRGPFDQMRGDCQPLCRELGGLGLQRTQVDGVLLAHHLRVENRDGDFASDEGDIAAGIVDEHEVQRRAGAFGEGARNRERAGAEGRAVVGDKQLSVHFGHDTHSSRG